MNQTTVRTSTGGKSYKVDDLAAVGAVGDTRLSLSEAIRLASGALPENALSVAERAQIVTGLGPAPSIEIVVGKGKIISNDLALPTLENVDGLTLDGGGAVLQAEGAQTKGKGLVIASSRVTLRDIEVLGYETPILIRPSANGQVEDVAITKVRVMPRNLGIHLLAQSKEWAGAIRRVSITNSVIEGPDAALAKTLPFGSANNGVRIEGFSSAEGTGTGEIDDVLVADNTFGLNLAEGVDMAGTTAASPTIGSPSAPAGTVRNVTVRGNKFMSCGDICVLGYGGMAVGKDANYGLLTDVSVTGNTMLVKGNGVYIVGGYTLMKSSTKQNVATRLSVRNNIVSPVPGGKCEGVGFAFVGHSSDLADGRGDGSVRGVEIVDNTVQGCSRGVALGGAKSGGTGNITIEGANSENVKITGNRFTDTAGGVEIIGASVFKGGLMKFRPPGQKESAVFRMNAVRDVIVDDNIFTGVADGIIVAGSSAIDVGAYRLEDNLSENIVVRNNKGKSENWCRQSAQIVSNSSATSVSNAVKELSCK